MKPILLRGITWSHSRALPPLVATAQRFEEQHPGVRIEWAKRTLHEFGHADIETLSRNFDLLVIDHPMAGDAEATGAVADLLPLLSREDVEELRNDAIGPSFDSYLYHGHLYALPIDAAAPAASFRPDLLDRYELPEPKVWSDVVSIARTGLVRMSGFSADLFLNFLGLCFSRGSRVGESDEALVDDDIGVQCLEQLSELASLMGDTIYTMNPIALYEEMSRGHSIAYCPFAYTYNNYSREGFAARGIRFADPVALETNIPLRTVLGGTGIALSAGCEEISLALEYSLFVAGRTCQRTIYALCGGQPVRRSAWRDPLLNQITGNFFSRTVASMERAWVRPRFSGYFGLQQSGGELLIEHCRSGGKTRQTLDRINAEYRAALKEGLKHV